MNNNFLRTYTIPVLQRYTTTPESTTPDTHTQIYVEESAVPNSSRYCPPGGQVKSTGSLKRSYVPALREVTSEDSSVKIPIFTGRDRSYPDELNLLINPLFCELCKVKLNSQKTAVCHYESKQHDRKITAWLTERYPDNPPPIKRLVKDGPTGPDAFRCEDCDLPLTSMAHAKQHYAGRKHLLVVNRKSDPSGAGFYDDEGKWIRTGSKKNGAKPCDNRFGIGDDFVPSKIEEKAEDNVAADSSKSGVTTDESLFCKICNVVATSSYQMEMHLSGSKHKKKLATADVTEILAAQQNNISSNANSILASVNIDIKPLGDLSMYRTPTGSYYCQICNTTMNHVSVLLQHIQGRKHKIKEKSCQTKPTNQPNVV